MSAPEGHCKGHSAGNCDTLTQEPNLQRRPRSPGEVTPGLTQARARGLLSPLVFLQERKSASRQLVRPIFLADVS